MPQDSVPPGRLPAHSRSPDFAPLRSAPAVPRLPQTARRALFSATHPRRDGVALRHPRPERPRARPPPRPLGLPDVPARAPPRPAPHALAAAHLRVAAPRDAARQGRRAHRGPRQEVRPHRADRAQPRVVRGPGAAVGRHGDLGRIPEGPEDIPPRRRRGAGPVCHDRAGRAQGHEAEAVAGLLGALPRRDATHRRGRRGGVRRQAGRDGGEGRAGGLPEAVWAGHGRGHWRGRVRGAVGADQEGALGRARKVGSFRQSLRVQHDLRRRHDWHPLPPLPLHPQGHRRLRGPQQVRARDRARSPRGKDSQAGRSAPADGRRDRLGDGRGAHGPGGRLQLPAPDHRRRRNDGASALLHHLPPPHPPLRPRFPRRRAGPRRRLPRHRPGSPPPPLGAQGPPLPRRRAPRIPAVDADHLQRHGAGSPRGLDAPIEAGDLCPRGDEHRVPQRPGVPGPRRLRPRRRFLRPRTVARRKGPLRITSQVELPPLLARPAQLHRVGLGDGGDADAGGERVQAVHPKAGGRGAGSGAEGAEDVRVFDECAGGGGAGDFGVEALMDRRLPRKEISKKDTNGLPS